MSVTFTQYGDPDEGADEGLEKSIIETCMRIAAQTKVLAPVAPDFGGALRNSYMWKAGGKNGGLNDSPGEKSPFALQLVDSPKRGFVGSPLAYAIYQEFGTRKMAPQPHFRPAIAIVVDGADTATILKKINAEEMLGAIKKGQKRTKF